MENTMTMFAGVIHAGQYGVSNISVLDARTEHLFRAFYRPEEKKVRLHFAPRKAGESWVVRQLDVLEDDTNVLFCKEEGEYLLIAKGVLAE